MNSDQIIDVVRGNRVYIPALMVINKIDLADRSHMKHMPDAIEISADLDMNLDVLRDAIYDTLGFINICLSRRASPADMDEPMIMREGCSRRRLCDRLHKDFRRKFRYARVWGDSANGPASASGSTTRWKTGTSSHSL